MKRINLVRSAMLSLSLCMFFMYTSDVHAGKNETLTEKEACRAVHECFLRAFVDLYLDQRDGTFPRRDATSSVKVYLPKSFTNEQAMACGRGEGFSQSTALHDKLSVTIIRGQNNQPDTIQILAERANYDQAKADYHEHIYNSKERRMRKLFAWYDEHYDLDELS